MTAGFIGAFLLIVGLLWPLLGRLGGVFVHQRIVSILILLASLLFLSLHNLRSRTNKHPLPLFVSIAFVVLAGLYYQDDFGKFFLNISRTDLTEGDERFVELLLAIPALICAYLVPEDERSHRGVAAGAILMGTLSTAVLLYYHELFFTAEWQKRAMFAELQLFSPINISIISSLAVVSSLWFAAQSKVFFKSFLYLSFSLLCFAETVLCLQRVHGMFLIVILMLFIKNFKLNLRRMAISSLGIMIVVKGVDLFRLEWFGNAISYYSGLVRAFDVRLSFFTESWNLFIDNPLGLGLGQSEQIYGLKAHNLILESAADMGIVGLLFSSWLTYQILKHGWSLASGTYRGEPIKALQLPTLFGLFYLLHSMKSGYINSYSILLPLWVLFGKYSFDRSKSVIPQSVASKIDA